MAVYINGIVNAINPPRLTSRQYPIDIVDSVNSSFQTVIENTVPISEDSFELTGITLDSGTLVFPLVTYNEGAVEEFELTGITLDSGVFEFPLVTYNNGDVEEFELTGITLDEGTLE